MGLIRQLLYPARCPGCDEVMTYEERQAGFCTICRPYVTIAVEPLCKCCGKPLHSDAEELCRDCRGRHHLYKQGRAVYVYEGPMREAMYRYKYSNRRGYVRSFVEDAMRSCGRWIERCGIDIIVPVPMYRDKERRRGYNQATVFAKELGRRLGLPAESRAVVRAEDTKPQKGLDYLERRQNLKNAFNIGENVVKSKRILLVDDIYTTGTTMDAVSGTLLASGAEAVYGLYICIGRDN